MSSSSLNNRYVLLKSQTINDEHKKLSTIQFQTDTSLKQSTDLHHLRLLIFLVGACMFVFGAFVLLKLSLFTPKLNDCSPSTADSIQTFESYSEQPHGYWTNANNTGTHFNSFGLEQSRYEPLVDRLIGENCGGYSDLNYQDFSSLAFLRNQSILMIGDSTDRYLVQYMCGSVKCDRCPKPCEYTRNVLKAQFKHYTYSGIHHENKELVGISSCHIPILNFTLSQAMTYSILPERYNTLPERYISNAYFSYDFSKGRSPTDGPYTYRNFIQEFVSPFFIPLPNNTISHIPYPTIITAQSGLWDIMLLTYEQQISVFNASIDLRYRWWREFEANMIPAIDETFPNAKLKYLRTIPPVHDYDNGLCAQISSMMRSKIVSLRKNDPKSRWRLWDIASMLAECENYLFDDHHYGPNIMNQLLNVLLNDIKARQLYL